MSDQPSRSPELTVEEFVNLAFAKLRAPGREGLHTRFSGFNAAFRSYFPDLDPVAEVKRLAKDRKIKFRLTRGGAVIYPPDTDVEILDPQSVGGETLRKMGL